MDISKILDLVSIKEYPPEIKGQISELVEILTENPDNEEALSRLLFLLGVDKLDIKDQEAITENLKQIIDMAAENILESIGKAEFEKRKINRFYLQRVNEGDADIAKFSKKPVKSDFKWRKGYGEDSIKSSPDKISKGSYKWDKSDGLSPLSGKKYGGQK